MGFFQRAPNSLLLAFLVKIKALITHCYSLHLLLVNVLEFPDPSQNYGQVKSFVSFILVFYVDFSTDAHLI